MRTVLMSLSLIVLAFIPAAPASASQPEAVTIETSRLRGAPGTFSATGGIEDAGTFTTLNVHASAAGAPTFLIIHATYEFVGERGTFTIRLQIKETATADPAVLTGQGAWVVLRGTGAYANLHAEGTVTGVVDERAEPALFVRTYTGNAHVD
jgi:hypothetical protein